MASKTPPSLVLLGADTGKSVSSDAHTRDIEFSVRVYLLVYGRWPTEYPNGFFATKMDGSLERPPKAAAHPNKIYSRDSLHEITGPDAKKVLLGREKAYKEHAERSKSKLVDIAKQKAASAQHSPYEEEELDLGIFSPDQEAAATKTPTRIGSKDDMILKFALNSLILYILSLTWLLV